MATDFTKDPDQILIDLINEENGRNIELARVNVGRVSIAADPVEGREPFNNIRTSVNVSALVAGGYKGAAQVQYNRVPVRNVFPTTDPMSVRYPQSTAEFQLAEHINLVDLLPEINAKYHINLTPDDIIDVALPQFTGAPPYDAAYVRFEIKSVNKIFIGGINIRILPNDVLLSDIITITELNGLIYPGETDNVVATMTAINTQLLKMAQPGYW